MIKCLKTVLLTSLLLIPSMLYAQTESSTTLITKQPPPYGDNPNIFKVLAYKTKEKIENIAAGIGNATERGIEKTKPTVDQVWENTKNLTDETTTKVKTKVLGDPNESTTIVQRPLSEASISPQEIVVINDINIISTASTKPLEEVDVNEITVTPIVTPVTNNNLDDDSSIPR